MHPKDILGRQVEELAVEHLLKAGFRIRDRNYRCAEGAIDIVAADRRVLVACEVKTRSGVRYGTPIEAVTNAKLRRLRRLAVHWVLAHGVIFDELRVDIAGVLRSRPVSSRSSMSAAWDRAGQEDRQRALQHMG